ncbi:hypothetical protein Poli38472_013574 [Pythium oligandrum]|uniref:Armadillo-type fold n=1 Tax=Pythium oligandrum TaxID=41045 RepID=A0A8K1FG01_PYTOL|nr:hypothetical protein Poli38472_013574 [Pythium oligandrum]|eukprot:TMW61111.1 hypothetical protein Poli38472_013574 [Pythium oligandrum]
MNLSALWSLEKTRLAECVDDTAAEEMLSHEAAHSSHSPPRLKRMSSESVLVHSKKKTSTTSAVAKRELLFKKLLDESVAPGIKPVTPTVPIYNEFAIEYADRAPKRFISSGVEPTASSATVVDTKRRASDVLSPSAVATRRAVTSSPHTSRNHPTTTPANPHKAQGAAAGGGGGGGRRHPRRRDVAAHAFRPYQGDMFSTRGDYVDGMIYMSRMKRSHQLTFGTDGNSFLPQGRNVLKDAVADALSAAVAASAAGTYSLMGATSTSATSNASASTASVSHNGDAPGPGDPELTAEEVVQLRQRQRCALTLSNWSSNPENAWLMVQENVVEALMQLCEAEDRVTRLHCVTALMNLSNVEDLRRIIVQQGAIKTIADIVNDTDDPTLRTACAVTLCNLCCLEGDEELLVADGAVSALSLLINEHPKVARLCLAALFNLTCVTEPYTKIESVLKVFLTLAASPSTVTRDEILVKGVCNLSNLKRIRVRLMEEGMVSVVPTLLHATQPLLQQLLAYILLNLSTVRACRSELVAKGAMGALVAITGAANDHMETKQLVALTLAQLSKEPGNRLRMVLEGLLLLVHELLRGNPPHSAPSFGSETLRVVCARTLYNVSCNDETRAKLVERDAVNTLSTLSQRCLVPHEDDGKRLCTLTLCNLLSVQSAAADIVATGAISSLIQLSVAPHQTIDTRHVFAKALYGLCERASTRSAVVRAGIIPALLKLSAVNDETPTPSTNATVLARQATVLSEVRGRCVAALACLASAAIHEDEDRDSDDHPLRSMVCTVDVVQCVTQLLILERFNVAIERFCCACLSLLCRDPVCARCVAEGPGTLRVILQTCLESADVATKASCCHIVASMSGHPGCGSPLVGAGVLGVLETLARSKGDASIQRCCALTLANISSDIEIRRILLGETPRVVALLSGLSNSYSEESQRDCATVLCNLSCLTDVENGAAATLVRHGAVPVLLMVGMVRALQPRTKETCIRAFTNFLTSETVVTMVQEGLVKVLPAFVSNEIADTVVAVLYAKLLSHPDGREALCSERAALRALFTLLERSEELRLGEHMLSSLVYYDVSRERSVHAGILDVLHTLVASKTDTSDAQTIALLLFTLAKHDATRLSTASAIGLSTLRSFLTNWQSHHPSVDAFGVEYTVATVAYLAWHDETRARLEEPEMPTTVLTQLLKSDTIARLSSATSTTCLLTLCCLSHSYPHLQRMLQDGLLTHLTMMFTTNHDDDDSDSTRLALACILFRQLSHAHAFTAVMMIPTAHTHVLQLFCALTKRVVAAQDCASALDCADALCSIAFLPAKQSSPSKATSLVVRRQSLDHTTLRSSVSVTSSVPPAALVAVDVLEAIASLLTVPSQLPETRWRCVAALYALSCITEYRHKLVGLGVTRVLVDEVARSTDSTVTPEELEIIRCCAGTLCHLTMVSKAATIDGNAARMVEDGAVPALIHLAAIENNEIREHCTLALSNLSRESPKVESGAVSALLSLTIARSRDMGKSAMVAIPSTLSTTGVTRPPVVEDERYKEIARLPDFEITLVPPTERLQEKHEAGRQVSQPPAPPVPTIGPDVELIGSIGGGSGLGSLRPDGEGETPSTGAEEKKATRLRRQRSASYGDNLLGLASPLGTPSSARTSARTDAEEVRSGLPILDFGKVDPVESRAWLAMESKDDDRSGDDDTSAPAATAPVEQTVVGASDPRTEPDEVAAHRTRGAASNAKATGLSPLARVVVRKTQTTHAAKKFKDLKRLGSSSSSLSSLSYLATVHEQRDDVVQSRSYPVSRQSSLTTSFFPVHTVVSTSNNNETVAATEPPSSIAAQAAAALLYSPGILSPVKQTTTSTKKPRKTKAKNPEPVISPQDEPPRKLLVTSVEDVQVQVRRLGLWC